MQQSFFTFLTNYSIPNFISKTENIKKLSMEQKLSLALQICYFTENGFLYDEEDQLKDYLKQLTADSNQEVRVLIANQLKSSRNLPHEVALKLAFDINKVAVPIITYSPQLTDSDLIQILDDIKEANKLVALTQRNNLSEEICFKIFSMKDLNLIINVIKNPTSQVSFELYRVLINAYHKDRSFLTALSLRNGLDDKTLRKLALELDAEAKKNIIRHFNLHVNRSTTPFCPTNITYFEDHPLHEKENELRKRVDQLYSQNSLNNAIIIHFLCKGDLYSFLYSISKLSEIPFSQVKFIILNHLYTEEFKKLFYSSGLPTNFMAAIQAILNAIIIGVKEGENTNKENFSSSMRRFIKENKIDRKMEGMSYLMKLITRR